MCGGRGKRLGMGEKPLVRIERRYLIDYVLDELWFCEVYGVTTAFTPKTENYLESQGVRCLRTSGKGYIEDYVEAILKLGLFEPILIVSADLVILQRDLILNVAEFYFKIDKPALKVVNTNGEPVGINVIDGMFYDCVQDEEQYVVDDNKVININTPEDLMRALCLIRMKKREGGWWKDLGRSSG